MKLEDLLKVFHSGPWFVYEQIRDDAGSVIDTDCVATSESPLPDKLRNREVESFTGCRGFGINVYLKKAERKGR
jgi:hypothetical protein